MSQSSASTYWSQSVYGKLVLSKGGPIVDGFDYARTGLTNGIPDSILAQCVTSNLGIKDNEDWAKYPWLGRQGTLVLRPILDSATGIIYLQAARIFPRLERENDPTRKRHFVQSAYLTIPLESLDSDASLFALPDLLRAEPMTRRDADLPKIHVDFDADQALPGRWWDKDHETMLEALVSGHRAAIQDRECSPDDFFRRAVLCLACLPKAIRWRVPIGGGFYHVPDEFGLFHGMLVDADVRKISGVWKVDVDVAAGRSYAQYLKPHLGKASTYRDLFDRVDQLFPILAKPFALSRDDPWFKVIVAVTENELILGIKDYIADKSRPRPDVASIRYFRPQAVGLILRAVAAKPPATGAVELLPNICSEEWRPHWEAEALAASSERLAYPHGLAMLLGIEPFRPEALDPSTVPRLNLVLNVQMNREISRAFAKAKEEDLYDWERLLVEAGNPKTEWLDHWKLSDRSRIFWRAFRYERRTNRAVFQKWLKRPSALLALSEIFAGDIRDRTEHQRSFARLGDWIDADVAPEVEQTIREMCEAGRYSAAIALNDVLKARTGLAGLSLQLIQGRYSSGRSTSAKELAEGFQLYGPTPSLSRALASVWPDVPIHEKTRCEPELAATLGPLVAYLLLGGSMIPDLMDQRSGLTIDIAEPLLVDVIRQGDVPEIDDRLLRLIEGDAPEIAEFVRRLLRQAMTASSASGRAQPPKYQFVKQIEERAVRSWPDLSLSEARTAFWLAPDLRGTWFPTVPGAVHTLGQARACAILAAATKGVMPPPEAILGRELLTRWVQDEPERQFWMGCRSHWQVPETSFWRLCDFQWRPELTGEEAAIILGLEPVSLLDYAVSSQSLWDVALGRITGALALGELKLDDRRIAQLYELSTIYRNPALIGELFRRLVTRLNPQDRAACLKAFDQPHYRKIFGKEPIQGMAAQALEVMLLASKIKMSTEVERMRDELHSFDEPRIATLAIRK